MRQRKSREISIGELLLKMINAFSGKILCAGAVRAAAEALRDYGFIETSTFDQISGLFPGEFYYAVDFLADGSVRYTSDEMLKDPGTEEIETVTFDPVEVAAGIVSMLQDDRQLGRKLGFRFQSVEELIERLSDEKLPCSEPGSMFRLRSAPRIIYDGCVFWLRDMGCRYMLCFDTVQRLKADFGIEQSGVISDGMSGEIFGQGSDLYFGYNRASAYLHIDMKSGEQEILQNGSVN